MIGGAVPHMQLAGLIFTNSSPKTCSLKGYPSVQLLKGGAVLGAPAQHASGTVALVALRAGQSAQALLSATTTCNAPLSDQFRVSAPGQHETVDVSGTVRACVVSIGPVQPSS